jgi:hypothetical protein
MLICVDGDHGRFHVSMPACGRGNRFENKRPIQTERARFWARYAGVQKALGELRDNRDFVGDQGATRISNDAAYSVWWFNFLLTFFGWFALRAIGNLGQTYGK